MGKNNVQDSNRNTELVILYRLLSLEVGIDT